MLGLAGCRRFQSFTQRTDIMIACYSRSWEEASVSSGRNGAMTQRVSDLSEL